MRYTQTTPCKECPFLKKFSHAYSMQRLREFASVEFPCHKSATLVEDDDGFGDFLANENSVHCAGALIFNQKRKEHNRFTQTAEFLNECDLTKIDMKAPVR